MKRSQTNIRKQSGWTFWSLTFTLAVVGFFAYVGMKLVPVYTGDSNIYNAMKRSVDGKNLAKITRSQIIAAINAQLYLDGSHEMINIRDKNVLKIKKARGKLILEAIYERKIPLFFNLSLSADFNPTVECELSGKCD